MYTRKYFRNMITEDPMNESDDDEAYRVILKPPEERFRSNNIFMRCLYDEVELNNSDVTLILNGAELRHVLQNISTYLPIQHKPPNVTENKQEWCHL